MGAGALNGDTSGSMANMLGIPKSFVNKVYSNIMDKNAFSLVPIIMVSHFNDAVIELN